MLLISCEVSLTLAWSKNWALTRNSYREAVPPQGNNTALAETNNPTGATFKITDTEL